MPLSKGSSWQKAMNHLISHLYGASVGVVVGAITAGLAFILAFNSHRMLFWMVMGSGAALGCVFGFRLSPTAATYALLGFMAALVACAFLLFVLVLFSGGSRDSNPLGLLSGLTLAVFPGAPLTAAVCAAAAITFVWFVVRSRSALAILCVCELLVMSLGTVSFMLFQRYTPVRGPGASPGKFDSDRPSG